VRVSPVGSPELQALLMKKGPQPSVIKPQTPTTSSLSSPANTCEIQGCTNIANYEAKVGNQHYQAIARVCLEHATDNINDEPTLDLQLINADNMSAYSLSTISLSDRDGDDRVKQIVRDLKTKPLASNTAPPKRRKTRSGSDPSKVQQVTFDITSDEDFPPISPSATSQKNPRSNSGTTKEILGDSRVSEKLISKIAQSKKDVTAQKGYTNPKHTPKKAKTNRTAEKPKEIDAGNSSEEELTKGFWSVMVPITDHPTPFPQNPSNRNAIKLRIDGEPVGAALD
ncbi:1273_t:CDS:1, partial [Paraglomus brasilianum]